VLGRDAGVDRHRLDDLVQLVVVDALELDAGDDPVAAAIPSRSAMASAVVAWSPVIISTRMPGLLAAAHGLDRLVARRIDHALQADERSSLDVLVGSAADLVAHRARGRPWPARAGPRAAISSALRDGLAVERLAGRDRSRTSRAPAPARP
jgi:hypothetical protein